MKKIIFFYSCALLMLINQATAQVENAESIQADSTLTYVNGEGLFLRLGKGEGTKFNLLTTVQSGLQLSQFDSANTKKNTNRLSLNLVRVSLQVSALKDKLTVGIVTDFTSTTPILEGWIGLSFMKNRAKIILGQKQTHTNNRLAMADERFAQTMGQTLAGKSIDGTAIGGLMQNFVGATREGGLYLETNFSLNNWRIYPSASITTGEGQNFFSAQPNVGFKYGGRLDILPLGDFIKNNAFIAHDIYRESKPKLAIGFAASYNAKVSSPIGSENGVITGIYDKLGKADFANYRKVVADFIFKHKGFALVGEFINGTVTGSELYTNIAGTNKLTTELAGNFYNIGSSVNVQTSYVTQNGWAIDARFTTITPEFKNETSLVHNQKWYTIGINKYIKNNAVRVGINSTYINDDTPTISTKKWTSNIALQILL
jgi:hypothetical protein